MPLAPLEVRDGDRAGEGGVERDRDDHGVTRPTTLWTVRAAYHPMRPASPGFETERAATSGREPEQPPAGADLDPAEHLPRRTGSDSRDRRDDALGQRLTRSARRVGAAPRRRAAAARGRTEARPSRTLRPRATASTRRYWRARRRGASARSALRCDARRAAEDRRVDRRAVAAHGRDLAPAGVVGVARLDAEDARDDAEQVVPGVERRGRRRSSPSTWRTAVRTAGIAHRRRARAASRRGRSSTRRARRGRRGGRSASR